MFFRRELQTVGLRQKTVRGMGFRGRRRKGNQVVRRGLRPLSEEGTFDGCAENEWASQGVNLGGTAEARPLSQNRNCLG